MTKSLVSALALTALMALGAANAQAQVFSPCAGSLNGTTYNIADNVTGSMDCIISDQTQDSLQPTLTVNETPGFFGFTDWQFGGKDESGGQQGTWDIDANVTMNFADTSLVDYMWMLIFKDGAGTTLVGYLLQDDMHSGSWTTPFENPPFLNANGAPKDVSHISYYVRTDTSNDLPEPGTLSLLSLGMIGIAALRRNRKAV